MYTHTHKRRERERERERGFRKILREDKRKGLYRNTYLTLAGENGDSSFSVTSPSSEVPVILNSKGTRLDLAHIGIQQIVAST